MEHSLTKIMKTTKNFNSSLNPYSNGTLSDSKKLKIMKTIARLNPYSNGTLSDNLKESKLRFFIHPCYSWNTRFRQRVNSIRMIFSQM